MKSNHPPVLRALPFCVALAAVLAGCSLVAAVPPFQYLSAGLVVGEESCHELVGIHYSIRSLAGADIAALHASFSLFDSDGNQLPKPGGNYFDVVYAETIPAGSAWEICTSLDTSFYFRPGVPLVAERFRIYRVDFTDGSSWSDPFGLYRYPYEVISSAAGSGYGAQP